MQLTIILTIILCFVGLAGFIWWQLKNLRSPQKDAEQLQALVNQALTLSSTHIAEQTKHILQGDKELIQNDLANKHHQFQLLMEKLQREIDERQKEIRALEQDRQKSFASVREAIEQHQSITKELSATTQTLAKVLSNNQQRGEWGEHVIEDLLQNSGLMEGVHYKRQAKLGATTDRPDITLMLPNQRVVPIDVKFPFSAIYKLSTAQNAVEKSQHEKQFASDVKAKIKKVAEYIQPDQDTLDYAILFVPNEMLFSYINQQFPELVNEAMSKRVLMVSPFTFLIVARTILETYRNFMMESNLRVIVKQIGEFAKEWERFIDEFDKFGDSIGKMDTAFRQIRDTRHKQLSKRMEKIEEYQIREEEPTPLLGE